MSEFKVGDKVVYLNHIAPEHEEIYEIYYLDALCCFVFHIGFDYRAMYGDIRHATPEEIAAGHRLDCETLDKPENHISPNCKSKDV